MRYVILVVVACLVGAGCYGLTFINWSVTCPKGKHLVYEYSIPLVVSTGKTTFVSIDPIYGCKKL